jgi:hypothetical protein
VSGADTSGEMAVLRASARRLATYGVTGPSIDGWTAVPAEAVAPVAVSARTPGCVLRWATTAGGGPPGVGSSLTVYGPRGEVVQVAADVTADAAERAAALLDRPGAGALLHRALTVDWPAYEAPARVGDVCRALGVPLALLTVDSTEDTSPAPAGVDVGLVLGRLDPGVAAAQSALTGQSGWIVPQAEGWYLRIWDREGARHPLPAIALTLSQGHRDRFALAVWWTGGPAAPGRRAGLLVARAGRAVAAHEWSPRFDLGLGHTAGAGRTLAATFGVPGRALDVTAALRRDASDPLGALVDLLTRLRVPTSAVGLGEAELVELARSTAGAVHSPRLSPLRAVVHAIQQAPATTVVERAARERPAWYRVANAGLAVVMALATVVLYLNWRWGTVAVGWVALAAATTVGLVLAVRPRRRRRR